MPKTPAEPMTQCHGHEGTSAAWHITAPLPLPETFRVRVAEDDLVDGVEVTP
jgi:hypothetical protein